MHIPKLTQPDAKLPLPKWETDRIRRYRAILDTLIEKANELALVAHGEALQQAAARAEAREAAPPPSKSQAAAKLKTSGPEPSTSPAPPRTPGHAPFRADLAFKSLTGIIQACIRLDAWLADRLVRGHTTLDLAGLAHPARADMLAYLHNAARLSDPYEDRFILHRDLETRVSQELALTPDRNPADIIAELCTVFQLPFDDEDFPNNWRCETFAPPEGEPWECPEDPAEVAAQYHELLKEKRYYHRE